MEKKPYNMERRNQAAAKAMLRALVCGYLLYLAWQLAFQGGEDPAFPPAARILAGILFAAAAAAFGIYTWKQYQSDRKGAELTPEEEAALHREQEEP